MKTITLFPTQVLQFNLENLDHEKMKDCIYKNLDQDQDLVKISGTNLYEYEPMKDLCAHTLEFTKQALDFYGYQIQPLNFRSMWAVEQKKGGFLKQHGHSNSWITGCYYLEAYDGDEIIFHDPRPRALQLQSKVETWNSFNTPIHKLKAEAGRMYIFPSWLEHSTEYVRHNKSRLVVSWNFKIPENLSTGFGDYG